MACGESTDLVHPPRTADQARDPSRGRPTWRPPEMSGPSKRHKPVTCPERETLRPVEPRNSL